MGARWLRCRDGSPPAELAAQRRAYTHIPEAVTAAYAGLPAVLVLSAKRI